MYAKLILDLDEEENLIIEKKYQQEKTLKGNLNFTEENNETQKVDGKTKNSKWDL